MENKAKTTEEPKDQKQEVKATELSEKDLEQVAGGGTAQVTANKAKMKDKSVDIGTLL